VDGDGTWDYIYDPMQGLLTPYAQDIEEKQQRKELLWMPTLIIMIIIVTVIALIIATFYKENK
jgi:heme/copper-type cytochrome/quinol oxidase subunit 2